MRWIVGAAGAAVTVVALYFALLWGGDAVRAFASASYGLGEFGGARDVVGIGRALALHADGLFRLAAFLGAFKLVGAVAFGVHLVDRIRAFTAERAPEHQMLEAALLLVVLLTLVAALAAMMRNDAALLRAEGLNLFIAALASLLGIYERRAFAAVPQRAAARRARLWTRLPLAGGLDRFVRRMSDDVEAAAPTGSQQPVS